MTPPNQPDPILAAQAYEDGLVPALMAEWVPRLVAAAHLRPGQRVLDVACGTGVLARGAAASVAPGGSVTGLDLDPGMLAVAASVSPHLTWHQGSAEALPFPPDHFHAVVSQFGLMFVPSPAQALREMWRVLKPGGRLAVAVWAALEMTPAYNAETQLIERIAGPAASSPLRLPFSLGDPASLRACFQMADVPLASFTTIVGTGRFASIRAMVAADVVGWLPLMGIHLSPGMTEAILQAAEHALAEYRQADGTVAFASPAHIAVAIRH